MAVFGSHMRALLSSCNVKCVHSFEVVFGAVGGQNGDGV